MQISEKTKVRKENFLKVLSLATDTENHIINEKLLHIINIPIRLIILI